MQKRSQRLNRNVIEWSSQRSVGVGTGQFIDENSLATYVDKCQGGVDGDLAFAAKNQHGAVSNRRNLQRCLAVDRRSQVRCQLTRSGGGLESYANPSWTYQCILAEFKLSNRSSCAHNAKQRDLQSPLKRQR